jgi:tellurite resistance protein
MQPRRADGVTIPELVDRLLAHFPAGDEGLMALVDLAVLVAAADGRIDDAEMAALTESIEAIASGRLGASLARHLVEESCAQIRAIGPEACARLVGEVLAKHHAAEEGLRLGLAVAWASEGVSAEERERLDLVARAAGVSAARLAELARESKPAGA